MKDKGKVLGIDYGDQRVGIAVCDENQQVAFGRTSIINESKKVVIEKIKDICNKENIVGIVVGLPLNLEGNKTDQTLKVEKFGTELEKSINIPIKYQDERLTSRESDVILTTLGVSGTTRKKEKDKIAASLILQNYLDSNRERGKKGEARD